VQCVGSGGGKGGEHDAESTQRAEWMGLREEGAGERTTGARGPRYGPVRNSVFWSRPEPKTCYAMWRGMGAVSAQNRDYRATLHPDAPSRSCASPKTAKIRLRRYRSNMFHVDSDNLRMSRSVHSRERAY